MSPLSTLNASRTVVPGPVAALPSPVYLGEHVSIRMQGRNVRGIVKYCGSVRGKPRGWVGIDLAEPLGWTDGTLDGHRYFTTEPSYGVFVQPQQVVRRDAAGRAWTPKKTPRSQADPEEADAEAADETSITKASKEDDRAGLKRIRPARDIFYQREMKITQLRHELDQLKTCRVAEEVTRLVNRSTTRWAKEQTIQAEYDDLMAKTTRWDLVPLHLIGQAEHARTKLRKSIVLTEGEGPRARNRRLEGEEEEEVRMDPRDQDFSSLRPDAGEVTWIELVEHRAITVYQLSAIKKFIQDRANDKGRLVGWYDNFSKDNPALYAKSVNLYQVARWIIYPLTERDRSSYIEAVSTDAELQKPSWFVSHWWGEAVLQFIDCVVNHQNVRTLSHNAAYWVCAYANNQHELGKELGNDPMASSFLKAMARSAGVLLILDKDCTAFTRVWCCFEEGVVTLAARNKLKTSGIQGERATLAALAHRDGKCGRRKPLLLDIATYCCRDEEQLCLCDKPIILTGHGHSACNGIPLCHGCLANLTPEDHRAFFGCHACEVYYCMKCNKKSKAELLTDGLTELEENEDEESRGRGWRMKVNREASFPLPMIKRGLRISILNAQSSQPIDKIRILNALANQDELDEPPPVESPNYHLVDRILQATFALAAWNQALAKNLDLSDHGRLPLYRKIRDDTNRTVFSMNLRGAFRNQADFDVMADTISYLTILRTLELDCSMCPYYMSVASLGTVIGGLKKLQDLSLDLHCTAITTGILELSEGLTKINEDLLEFSLEFRDCQGLPQPLQRHFSNPLDFVKKATWKARLEAKVRKQERALASTQDPLGVRNLRKAKSEDGGSEAQRQSPPSKQGSRPLRRLDSEKSESSGGGTESPGRVRKLDSAGSFGSGRESPTSPTGARSPRPGTSPEKGGGSSHSHGGSGEKATQKQKGNKSPSIDRPSTVPTPAENTSSKGPHERATSERGNTSSLRKKEQLARSGTGAGVSKVLDQFLPKEQKDPGSTPRAAGDKQDPGPTRRAVGARVSIVNIGSMIARATTAPSPSRPSGFAM